MDFSVTIDDNGVDVFETFGQGQSSPGAQDKYRRREAVRGRGIGCDNSHAAGTTNRFAGSGIENMVITDAILDEIALVVSGCRNGRICQRDRNDGVFLVARVLDANHPGTAIVIADDPAVTTGGNHRILDATSLQAFDALVHGKAFGDATQVNTHARHVKEHCAILVIQYDMTVIDFLE